MEDHQNFSQVKGESRDSELFFSDEVDSLGNEGASSAFIGIFAASKAAHSQSLHEKKVGANLHGEMPANIVWFRYSRYNYGSTTQPWRATRSHVRQCGGHRWSLLVS